MTRRSCLGDEGCGFEDERSARGVRGVQAVQGAKQKGTGSGALTNLAVVENNDDDGGGGGGDEVEEVEEVEEVAVGGSAE
jgi:hypothetical protein